MSTTRLADRLNDRARRLETEATAEAELVPVGSNYAALTGSALDIIRAAILAAACLIPLCFPAENR